MFDFAWSEILVIGMVAMVVIGPKDLPRVLRTLGKWASKARGVAREFQSSVEQMIRESELEEARKDLEKATSVDITKEIEHTIDPKGDVAAALTGTVESTETRAPATIESAGAGESSGVLASPAAPEAAPVASPEKTPTPV